MAPRHVLLWAAMALTGCSGTVEESPQELAQAVSGTITWDAKSLMKQIASTKGCDSYTPTWAPNDHLYTAVGDCQPAGVPRKIGMGFGRISGSSAYAVSFAVVPTGDPLNWDDAATGAGVEALGDGPAGEKASGMLHTGSKLWYWIRNINPGGTGVRLKFSGNYGTATPDFTWASWTLSEVGYASFVQFGKGYAGGPADYLYAVIPMRSGSTGSVSNSAYDMVPGFGLIRGARANVPARSSWKYFCGSSATPAWCSAAGSAKPILYQAGNQFNPRAGMSWNPGLGKFMLSLVVDPTPTTPDEGMRFYGGLAVLTSDNPWGPWETVFSSSGTWPGGNSGQGCGFTKWGAGERADIPTKYISADGKTFYLFSSGGDCLSIARGVLTP
jgi:hypothetical protein